MKRLHPVGLLLSCTCFLLCVPVRADIRREAEALVNWKASLVGADESLGSWLLANWTNLCRWRHISCNSAGHIKALDLTRASLNGTLDEFDFSVFPQMKNLILSQNGLYGTIPAAIGNLTSLVVLQISGNRNLRGTIPRSIGQLKHLAVLDLYDLGLNSTLPEEIGNLTSLQILGFGSVTLTGSIPPTIGMLVKLRELFLYSNNLTASIPTEIGNMTELQSLSLSNNYLEGQLPGTISHLRKFQLLYLDRNQLGGHISLELGNRSLSEIDISHNNFVGLFPPSVCVSGKMSSVRAEYNGFTRIHHQTFQNCTTLQFLDFTANNIVADLRGILGKHPWIQVVAFSQNQLYGTLLTEGSEVFLCNYTELNFLALSNNALGGEISKCLWDIPTLQFVELSSNSFSGVIPFSRTGLHGLVHLHLANNHFRGTFPLGLKTRKNLITLDLGGNNFSGTIPSWISKSMPELKFLRLSSNMFEGIIPHQILQFRQLQLLDLSKNKLSGPIPDDFTNFTGMAQELKNIDYIYTDHYMYAEQIQIVWKNVDYGYNMMIAAMAGIDLSGNSLSKEIPYGLMTLLGLRYLNLSGNLLSGCIPEDIGNLVLLESLDFSRNQLSGKIPPSFAALKDISALNLSSNELSGRIPMGSQLQTLVDPSIYSNNPGLCGFPLKDCVNSSTSTQNATNQAEDREALWLYCFMATGFTFGFWLFWGMFLFCREAWRCVFYQYVDNMQEKVTKKIYSCMSFFQASGLE